MRVSYNYLLKILPVCHTLARLYGERVRGLWWWQGKRNTASLQWGASLAARSRRASHNWVSFLYLARVLKGQNGRGFALKVRLNLYQQA